MRTTFRSELGGASARFRNLPRIATVVQGVVVVALGIAGALKLLNLESFSSDLATWTLVPEYVRSAAMIAVPTAEFAIACAWLFNIGRDRAVLAASALLTAYVVVALMHYHQASPPKCGCFGVLDRYFATLTGIKAIAVKSGAMLAILVAATALAAIVGRQRRALRAHDIGLHAR